MPGPWMPYRCGHCAGSAPFATRMRASSISSVKACRTLTTITRSVPLSRQAFTTAAIWWPQSDTPAWGKTSAPPARRVGARSHCRARSSCSSVPCSPRVSCSARYRHGFLRGVSDDQVSCLPLNASELILARFLAAQRPASPARRAASAGLAREQGGARGSPQFLLVSWILRAAGRSHYMSVARLIFLL